MLLRKIFKNSFFIGSYYILQKTLLFVFYIFLARTAGETGVGKFAFALSFVSLFSILADAGLGTLLVKDVARDHTQANKYLVHTLVLRFLLCIIAFSALLIIGNYTQLSQEKMTLLLIIGLAEFISVLTGSFYAIFRAHQALQYEASLSALREIISIIPAVFLMLQGAELTSIVIPFLLANSIVFLLSFFVVIKFVRFRFHFDSKFAIKIICDAAPFAVNTIAIMFFIRIDKVMLSIMKGDTEVGFYSIAHSLVYGLLAIPYIYTIVMFPVMSKFFEEKDQLKRILELSMKLFLLLGMIIGVVATIIAKDLIHLLYGASFDPSVTLLQYLIWICIFLFFRYIYINILGAIDKQKIAAVILLIMALVNVLLNYLLIPSYAALGAVWATFCTEIIGLSCGLYYLYKYIPNLSLKPILLKCVSIFAVLLIVSTFLMKSGQITVLAVSLPLLIMAYIGALLIFKIFTKEEIVLFKKIFSSKGAT